MTANPPRPGPVRIVMLRLSMPRTHHVTSAVVSALLIAAPLGQRTAAQSAPDPQQQVAALKQSLAKSQQLIRQYEWVETTIISLKGEEKARKQQRCYYGADGKVQKVPLGDKPQPQAQQGGGRGGRSGRMKERVVENKKDDMQDYMERAVALVQKYVPPDPARVQGAKDGGRMQVKPAGQGRVGLEFRDYLQPGDTLAIDMDLAASRLLGLNVATYLEKPDDKVTLAVTMGALPDGAGFAEQTTLEATAKNIRVVIQNGGHKAKAP
jgi:hypothetical protein